MAVKLFVYRLLPNLASIAHLELKTVMALFFVSSTLLTARSQQEQHLCPGTEQLMGQIQHWARFARAANSD